MNLAQGITIEVTEIIDRDEMAITAHISKSEMLAEYGIERVYIKAIDAMAARLAAELYKDVKKKVNTKKAATEYLKFHSKDIFSHIDDHEIADKVKKQVIATIKKKAKES